MSAQSAACKIFRANVVRELQQQNKNITELANALQMSRSGLSRMLNGHAGVTLSTAENIATYLGVSLASLLSTQKSKASA